MTDWEPARYAAYRDLRLRPALDLLAQVPDLPRGEIVDLGCGDGAVGPALLSRYPARSLVGVDSSDAMLANAALRRCYERLDLADIVDWQPDTPPALIYANAALNWVPDHTTLIPRLAAQLAPGGVLAVQMPRQGGARSHRMLREVAETLFPDRIKVAPSPVMAAGDYARLLLPLGRVNAWSTDYLHMLDPVAEGHPVRAFTESSAMRPYVKDLTPDERRAFVAAYDEILTFAYRPLPDGRVLFPFTRIFFVLERS
ncbi:methyltransferase domain-containing protein [Rhodobacter calidifons]|uniref:methyltransferase domain-containing protein n=1 Tax=Rhodobacter calidifons TaxID=2715277 RepID=UPI00349EC62D